MSHAPYNPGHEATPPWPPQFAPPRRNVSRALGILGLVLGLLGLGIGTAAWFRAAPKPEAAPTYSEEQVAEAKDAVCAAYARGEQAVQAAGAKTAQSPEDVLPIAVNTRLAEATLADHLKSELDANPATPRELEALMRGLTREYYEIALKQLSDGTAADIQPLAHVADDLISKIQQICP